MLALPAIFINLLLPFRPLFHANTWTKGQLLLVGDTLAPGKRTITSALLAVFLGDHGGPSVGRRGDDPCPEGRLV